MILKPSQVLKKKKINLLRWFSFCFPFLKTHFSAEVLNHCYVHIQTIQTLSSLKTLTGSYLEHSWKPPGKIKSNALLFLSRPRFKVSFQGRTSVRRSCAWGEFLNRFLAVTDHKSTLMWFSTKTRKETSIITETHEKCSQAWLQLKFFSAYILIPSWLQ